MSTVPSRRSRRRSLAADRPARDIDYSADPRALVPGNRVEPLVEGGQIFSAMLAAIDSAQRYVHLETYIFNDDRVGTTFAQALVERARAGVAVRVIVDAIGTWQTSAGFFGDLRDAGVQLHEFSPLVPWRRWGRLWQRDHRKILVVDGRVAFTGGINIADDYAPRELGGGGWRDTHCRVEGPLVDALEQQFRALWLSEDQPHYAPYPPPAGRDPAPGRHLAQLVHKDQDRNRTSIRRHYMHAFRSAQQFIYLANAYFVPDPGIRRALRRAARRGVRVAVIVPGRGDLRSVELASQATWSPLLRSGVEIHQWPETHMHAKHAVIDGVWTVIGSYNLDYQSLLRNLDVVVEVVDRELGAEMQRGFEADLQGCERVDLERWRQRSWWQRTMEWIFYRLRRWF
ncbi:MAG TPA: phospholipase D-like domain-containing protein [Kofleriaceae bacterium]|nr:phospholipase D-like domain-containing protein [Kofleriaceae bacterium]